MFKKMEDRKKTKDDLLSEITELRRQVAEQEEAHAHAQSIIDGIAEAIIVIDTDRQVSLINRAAQNFMLKGEETGTLTCHKYFHGTERPCNKDKLICPLFEVQRTGRPVTVVHEHFHPAGTPYFHEIAAAPYLDKDGAFLGIIETLRDVTGRKRLEDEREKLLAELKEALANIKTLKGLVPICAWCKKIRDDKGYWNLVEKYIEAHSEATFTHGICPECEKKVKEEAGL